MLPKGAIGEIVVGGAGVARGYLNNPELTAEKFRPQMTLMTQINEIKNQKINKSFGKSRNPFSKGFLAAGGILYRTGDLARWLPDGPPAGGDSGGVIEFLGRIDQQVKIRGQRVELAEIETRLTELPQIKQALLIAKEGIAPGERYLVGYIVGTGNINISELKLYLGKGLPAYMVPAYFVQLEKFPLTANGKVDIRALPEPAVVPGRNYIAPGNELEEKLVNIWKEILGKDIEVGVADNFFELGGNSLSLMQLASKINKAFKVEIPVSRLFKETTIREIARSIHRNDIEDHLTGPYFIFNPDQEKVIYCFPSQLAYGIVYRDLAAHLRDTVLYSFNFIESTDRCREYCQLITRHQAHGPYILFGYSGGGILIFEIAKELERQGYEVGSLIFLDIAIDLKKRLAGTVNQLAEEPVDFGAKVLNTLAEMDLTYLNDQVQAKLKSYYNYILSMEYKGKIKAGIHHIIAQDREENESSDLSRFTSGVYRTYRGFGSHRDMLSAGNIEKNAALIREILKTARIGH
jgi:thioesterase domain-containing protein/acyl carrier protein